MTSPATLVPTDYIPPSPMDEEKIFSRPGAIDVSDGTIQLPMTESQDSTSGIVITPTIRRKAWIQFATLCWAMYVVGWNDGTLGPLLLRLQSVYNVGYVVVSVIFIASCLGSIVGATTYLYLTDRFGFGMMMVIASGIMAVGNALQASGAAYPVFVIGYFFAGFGQAFLDSGSNAFVASLAGETSVKMGILHAVYGVGATCAPLVSTRFSLLPHWSFTYLVHVGLIIINMIFQIATFRFKSQEACLLEIGQPPAEKTKESEAGMNKYKQLLKLRTIHLMALFILTYVGVEVSIGGWIVTYIINERNGGTNSGYISSGYWGGLTVGRLALLWVNKKVGEWRVVFLYVIFVLGLELVVWQVPHLISSAVCISFVGFFLGPIFPIVMNHAGRVLPAELISGGIGWMAGFGAAGAAVFPFITGAIASETSIGSLQPLLISMIGLLLVIWACIPRTKEQLK